MGSLERLGYEAYQLKPDRLLTEGRNRRRERDKLRNVKPVLRVNEPKQYPHLRNRQSSGYRHIGVMPTCRRRRLPACQSRRKPIEKKGAAAGPIEPISTGAVPAA